MCKMTEAEYNRIKDGFEECNRRMQEYSAELAKLKATCSTLVEQVQRLKDAVAIAISRK